jgi:hypothetical protein
MSSVLEHSRTTAAEAAPAAPEAHRSEISRRFISAMMLGQMYGFDDDAQRLFACVSKIVGDSRQLRITLAFASAMSGDAEPARRLLAEGIDDWPDADMAKLSLSLALKVGGDSGWAAAAERTLAVSHDDEARGFAQRLLATPPPPTLSKP